MSPLTHRPRTPLTRRAILQGGLALAGGVALGASVPGARAQDATPSAMPQPGALVDPAWLAEHLSDPNLVLVNVELPDATDLAYIPGSVALVIPEVGVVDTSDASIEQWNQSLMTRLGELGVTADSTVVAYDNDTLFSARLWWVLHYLGHGNAHVLDGGISAWQAAGNEVVTEAEPEPGGEPYAGTPNGDLLAQLDEVLAAIDADDTVILDARVIDEYAEGHIPGAVNLNFPLNAAPEPPKVYKAADELTAMYAEIGVTPDKRVIPYCATGVRSAVSALALHLAGFESVALYTGSWAEWAEHPDTPKATGDQP